MLSNKQSKETAWPVKNFTSKSKFSSTRLESFRLIVRPASRKDQKEWAELRKKNYEFLQPLEPGWPEIYTQKQYFDVRTRKQEELWKSGKAYSFLIFTRKEEKMIGGINLNNVCRGAAHFASLGYWLDEDEQGKGYMREAARAVISFAFNETKLHRINAACLTNNGRSKNLLLKLGFTEEGYAKKYLKINNEWQDHILFGLNIEDWQE
jgi:ribosomal-protein-alanine N-acetyltransferase